MHSLLSVMLTLMTIATVLLSAQDKRIDVQRSTLTIHVSKSGVFSAAGHDHWINASIFAGVINESDSPHVEFKVEASTMRVKPDPAVDAKTQAEIQRNMQEKTLESAAYPKIAFRSSHIEKQSDGGWKVNGALTLHGVTKSITTSVKRNDGVYIGQATIKQTDFGIKPVTAAAGTVKVKNELEITFHVVTGVQFDANQQQR
jgi:polyisoprenoid-binding protein YceI